MSLEVRAEALEEARKCFRCASGLGVEDPELWANLLGAVANLMLACVPDQVFVAADRAVVERGAKSAQVREHLKNKLKGEDE